MSLGPKRLGLSQDLCRSGHESGTSEEVGLSQVLCRSRHTRVWDHQVRKWESETFAEPTPSQGPLQEQIQTRDIYRNRSELAT